MRTAARQIAENSMQWYRLRLDAKSEPTYSSGNPPIQRETSASRYAKLPNTRDSVARVFRPAGPDLRKPCFARQTICERPKYKVRCSRAAHILIGPLQTRYQFFVFIYLFMLYTGAFPCYENSEYDTQLTNLKV